MRSNVSKIALGLGLAGIGCLAFWTARKRRRALEAQKPLWSPGDSLKEIVEAHKEHLRTSFPKHHKKFLRILKGDAEAAQAEAAVFALLKAQRLRPEPADDPGTGGTDFLRRPTIRPPFVVEVTNLSQDSISRHSHIPGDQFEGGGAFEMVTEALFAKVRKKAEQLADYPHARVLAVTTSHHAAVSLFDALGAEWLLTSEPRITYPPEAPSEAFKETTDLASSIFFRPNDKHEIVPCRQSVSAVLLVGLYDDQCQVLGILHPEPAYPFDIGNFQEVPFVRVSEWPIVEGELKTEWIIANPQAKGFYHIAAR